MYFFHKCFFVVLAIIRIWIAINNTSPEITEPDGDSAEKHSENQEINDVINHLMDLNVSQDTEETNGNAGDIDLNAKNDIEVFVKFEPKFERSEDEVKDLPFVEFDPNDINDNSSDGNSRASAAASMYKSQTNSILLNKQKLLKINDGKRFKCEYCAFTARYKYNIKRHHMIHESDAIKPFKCNHCDYASRYKGNLKVHLRTHDRQKLLGIVQNPKNGLLKCTHCYQQFTKWHILINHLIHSHKNNQRLFNCSRCMRPFLQKTEKDNHEIRCQSHSAAKPFRCVTCNKSYRQKNGLKYHLDSIHFN